MKASVLIWFLFLQTGSWAQEPVQSIATGNSFYRQQQYDKAEAAYRKALDAAPANMTAKFNLANALIRQNKTDDAEKLLAEVDGPGNNSDTRPKATYNEGVILSNQKKLLESIEAYKQTLRLDPNDKEARENLQKALLELKKKNPPKKQEEKKKQQQQKQQPKPKISPREAEQQLKLLEQKEKQVQERLQKNARTGGSQPKDW
jgi:Ca-activated chloride channel homolog